MASPKTCTCGKKLANGTKGNLCLSCYRASIAHVQRYCIDCGTKLSRTAKARCRPCGQIHLNSDPELQRRRTEGLRRAYADPVARRRLSRQVRESFRDPARRQQRVEQGKRDYHRTLGTPKARAAATSPETRAKIAAAVSRTLLSRAGVPLEYRDLYIDLMRRKGKRRAEAVRIVRETIAAERQAERERLAALSPFERQMEALKRGATLTEKPVIRSRDYDFTLGGVTGL